MRRSINSWSRTRIAESPNRKTAAAPRRTIWPDRGGARRGFATRSDSANPARLGRPHGDGGGPRSECVGRNGPAVRDSVAAHTRVHIRSGVRPRASMSMHHVRAAMHPLECSLAHWTRIDGPQPDRPGPLRPQSKRLLTTVETAFDHSRNGF